MHLQDCPILGDSSYSPAIHHPVIDNGQAEAMTPPRRLEDRRHHACHDSSPINTATSASLLKLSRRQMNSAISVLVFAGLQKVAAAQQSSDAPSSSPNAPSESAFDFTSDAAQSNGTSSPSISSASPKPSLLPITIPSPTISPTVSFRPTNSSAPSLTPTSSSPTPASLPFVTQSPFIAPSAQPSQNETVSIERHCSQLLLVSESQELDEVEVGIYQLQMQSYTASFGHLVSLPFIVTTCAIFEQALAGGRKKRQGALSYLNPFQKLWPWRRDLQTTGTLLLIEFNIIYQTNYGLDISDYPSQFQQYINDNLEMVTQDMQTRFLPVVEAKEVIVYNTDAPTVSPIPTNSPSYVAPSTISPIGSGVTLSPTPLQSSPPSVSAPPSVSMAPIIPIITTPKPTRVEIVNDQRSFVVGLAAGLSAAALVVLIAILITTRKRKRQGGEAEASKKESSGLELGGYHRGGNGKLITNDGLEDGTTQITGEANEPIDILLSNPSMVSEGESLDSNPNDIQEGVPVETLQDEFDNYKNQDLEFMRNGVEESVYGAEGMMSLAMTRALMEDEEEDVDWGGAQDCASMEANIFCEVNDWLRKNEGSSLEYR
ncbi:hypothetical protein HJC23_012258 [Cyclotella cryptica]|uniref:Uncharacterized protein n=1 Tax=Cyclotella cryptica TaxID=29204 RepID=A0ABD3PN57_9STRA